VLWKWSDPLGGTFWAAPTIANGTLAAAIALGLRLWIPGLILWLIGHAAAVWAAKRDARFVEVAHEEGLAVHVWTIEEEAEMEELCGLGVDGIITDRPSALVGVLDRLGLTWDPR